MKALRTVLSLCLGSLCACEGSPGEARLQLLDPASAELGWRQTVPSQEFTVEDDAPDGLLRVATSDYCWDSNFIIDFDRATGKQRSQQRRQASAGTGGPPTGLNPPTGCEYGHAIERVTLSNGELVDVCGISANELSVFSVSDGRQRFRLSLASFSLPLVAGDHLVLPSLEPAGLETYSLLDGAKLWSWTAPEPYTYVEALDAERVYLLAETSRESFAFALADGTAVWQKNLGCDSLSLAGETLVCHQTLRASTCDHD